jgi:hypothetical protein
MLIFILNFFRRHWIGAAFCALAACIAVQRMEIRHVNDTLAQCRAENAAYAGSNARLAAAARSQDAAIAALRKAGEATRGKAAAALADAKGAAGQYTVRAQAIENYKASGDACADMITLLHNYVKEKP